MASLARTRERCLRLRYVGPSLPPRRPSTLSSLPHLLLDILRKHAHEGLLGELLAAGRPGMELHELALEPLQLRERHGPVEVHCHAGWGGRGCEGEGRWAGEGGEGLAREEGVDEGGGGRVEEGEVRGRGGLDLRG